jgi:hypothetical protein
MLLGETPVTAGQAGSPHPRRGKAVDNDGLRYGAMEARFARRYPPPLEPPLANRAFSSFCEGLNPGRLTHPAKRKQLRHQNLAQPTMCGVVASRLMPDRINRQRR